MMKTTGRSHALREAELEKHLGIGGFPNRSGMTGAVNAPTQLADHIAAKSKFGWNAELN